MEIRDVIHGAITIDSTELPILDSRYFQRLRQIKQLGFAENSFPSATHNRYIHSLGALQTATLAFDAIFEKSQLIKKQSKLRRFRPLLRLAALLHDIGHGPLSHTTEFAMPLARELKLATEKNPGHRRATHEDYTLKFIMDSGLTALLQKAGAPFGFKPTHIATLIDSSLNPPDDFFVEHIDGKPINFLPILRQVISSELDCDRMDYLRRDSLHAGVSYGHFDFDWLVSNLSYALLDDRCHLALQHRALYAFEDFLISRYHMFLMVYFHYKSVIFDEMLREYFHSTDCTYSLPADIEKYTETNDAHLYSHLATQTNSWARRISQRIPYRILIELHTGIPATKTAATEQQRLLARLKKDLQGREIHYIEATSTGELSKYFRKPGDSIYVQYDNHYSQPSLIPLEKCTDLFERYSQNRSITRLYVSPEDFAVCRNSGRAQPLRYEETDDRPQNINF